MYVNDVSAMASHFIGCLDESILSDQGEKILKCALIYIDICNVEFQCVNGLLL